MRRLIGLLFGLGKKQPEIIREMKKLVRACMGDKQKAERLIKYEKQKQPSITDIEAIRSAFDRLESDGV